MKVNGLGMKEKDMEYKHGLTVLVMKVIKFFLNNSLSLGFWLNGKAHGKGKFHHANGDVFEGEWFEDNTNG